jgi:translation initiation factor 3 subunit C
LNQDSEESVRVVKSAKTRAFEAFESTVKALRNAMRINDHQTLMTEFEVLSKAIAKSTKVFADNGGIPRFLVRILCDLEDHVQRSLADKKSFKLLKPAQGRALSRMKLSVKKYKETYGDIMEEYRKNPVVSSDSSVAKSSSSSSDSEEKKNGKDSDDSDSDSDDSSSSSSSSSSVAKKKAKPKAKAKKNDSDSVSQFQLHTCVGKRECGWSR